LSQARNLHEAGSKAKQSQTRFCLLPAAICLLSHSINELFKLQIPALLYGNPAVTLGLSYFEHQGVNIF
jgi:hypothetical protein